MMFPMAAGIGKVWEKQWDSKECYNKSLKLTDKREKLPQVLEVEKKNKGPMETNIDPYLQEKESTARPIEELIEVQVDPNEPSWVVKIGKRLGTKLAQQLIDFLHRNQDVFAWTHANMVGIHPKIICHWLNTDPQTKPMCQKLRVLDADRYMTL